MSETCPYEYITEENFDMVKGIIANGLTIQKPPHLIAEDLVKMVGLPEHVAKAIIGNEVGSMFDAWSDKKS
jgi:hypothetical protein